MGGEVILFFKLLRLLKFMSIGVKKLTENIMKNENGKYDCNCMGWKLNPSHRGMCNSMPLFYSDAIHLCLQK